MRWDITAQVLCGDETDIDGTPVERMGAAEDGPEPLRDDLRKALEGFPR